MYVLNGYGTVELAPPGAPPGPPAPAAGFMDKLKAFYASKTGKIVLGVVALAAISTLVYVVTKKKRKATPNKRRKKARKNGRRTRRARRNMDRPQFMPGTQESAKSRLGYGHGWEHARSIAKGGIGDPTLSMRAWRSGSGKQDPYGHAFAKAVQDYAWQSSSARKSRAEASPDWAEGVGEFYPGTYVRSPEAGEAPASGRHRESLVKPMSAPRETARFPSHPRRRWPIPEKIKRYSKSSPYRHRATPNKKLPRGAIAAAKRAAEKFNRMEPLTAADKAAVKLVMDAQGWGRAAYARNGKRRALANCGCG